MGKKSRAKRTSTIRPAPQLSSSNGHQEENSKVRTVLKRLWEKFKEPLISPLVVAFLATIPITLMGVYANRWTEEIGAHKKTEDQLARVEASEKNAIADRDQLKKELAALKKENSDLKSLHPILGFYGARAKIIASYDLKKEVGARLIMGQCPKAPCFLVTVHGIREFDKGLEVAQLSWSGSWEGLYVDVPSTRHAFGVSIPLKKGCSFTIKSRIYDITFAIEEDRRMDVRAGIGISPGTYSDPGFISSPAGDCEGLERKPGGSVVRR